MENPTFALCIPVYKGGIFWKECWASVRPLMSLFDEIIVSINYSKIQGDDINVILDSCKEENLKILTHRKELDPVDHFMEYYKEIKSDYVLFLAHDDWLIEEGVKEITEILANHRHENVAVFGSFAVSAHKYGYAGITRELLGWKDGINVSQFIDMDIDKYFDFNISGLVTPTKTLRDNSHIIEQFTAGIRFDNYVITHKGIQKIHQTIHPSVCLRIHKNQQGNIIKKRYRIMDNVTYYYAQTFNCNDKYYHHKIIHSMMTLAFGSLSGIGLLHLIGLLFKSLFWGTNLFDYYTNITRILYYVLAIMPKKALQKVIREVFLIIAQ